MSKYVYTAQGSFEEARMFGSDPIQLISTGSSGFCGFALSDLTDAFTGHLIPAREFTGKTFFLSERSLHSSDLGNTLGSRGALQWPVGSTSLCLSA